MDNSDTYVLFGMVVFFGYLYVRDLIVSAVADIEDFHGVDEGRNFDD